jgi:cupin superfamily acireductone dioxygenase involved in methionine salvage
VSIFSLGRIEFVLKGPDLIAVPNGYNQRFFLGENIHSFAFFFFFEKWNILLQDFSSLKTKFFL